MTELLQWRGFDLHSRKHKLERALQQAEVRSPEDVPVIANTPGYFAFASRHVPEDYFTNPASMVEYQARGYERHLATVNDDCIPYFMPWFGTGVLASAFGCPIRLEPGPGHDPAVAAPCITSVQDIARLRFPDPNRDGWMPRVLEAIDYARDCSDLPPGLTDMQGPLDTLGQMCGQALLYEWMYSKPALVHHLFELVTEAFIEWVKVQKRHIGEPLDSSNGLQGVWSPRGVGVWESADDLVMLDPGLYHEFVLPYSSRIMETFGGGSLHFCGHGLQHIENLRQMRGLRVVNTSPMGNLATLRALREGLIGVTIQVQDSAPLDVEGYYTRLFASLDDLRGLVLAPFVLDTLGMDAHGGYAPVEWDPLQTANRIVEIARTCAGKMLAGEPLQPAQVAPSFAVAKPQEAAPTPRPTLSDQQVTALAALQEILVTLDRQSIRAAVTAALETGVAPFDVVALGLAEGMARVGERYEQGEYFLPQLLLAGAMMKDGMAVLEPLLRDQVRLQHSRGTIVLGTVQGDLHDIGKNIVKTLLEAAGFTVHDIGVDRPAAAFVDKARKTQADIVALSALLTTTMGQMAAVIAELEKAGLRPGVRVMVGGAPISREFADRIGAEGYAPDAVKAVREAERLLERDRT